ncbi:MAG: Phenylacetic acid catabolic protein, partial [Ferruginibacter sp.]|nr:Phenylacetic acid catabolic protein [Ferruginibacter sp.]
MDAISNKDHVMPQTDEQEIDSLIDFTLHLADNTLIIAQRNAAWCGHGPILEQDIALTNISLDLLGQARSFYQYAAELINANACTHLKY